MSSVYNILVILLQVVGIINGSPACQNQPLGMENGNIPDEAITGFPPHPTDPPSNARLNKDTVWCAGEPSGVYLKIDLGTIYEVCAVATQGHEGGSYDYLKTYQVDWSLDGERWFEYKENNVIQIFVGNANYSAVKKNTLFGLTTRYVRFRPLTWFVWPCIRVEVYGRTTILPEAGDTLFALFGQDHALSGHVIKATVAMDAISCLRECMLDVPQCKSYNYNLVTTSCELNSATKEEYPGEFVKRVGFSYHAEVPVEVISF